MCSPEMPKVGHPCQGLGILPLSQGMEKEWAENHTGP